MDYREHEADGGHNDSHSKPNVDQGSYQVAGDVVAMPQSLAQQLAGNIAQSINERRTGSNLSNVTPLKRPGK